VGHPEFEPSDVRAARRVSEVSIAWTLSASTLSIALGIASASSALVAFGCVGYVDLAGSVALVHHFRHALRADALEDRFERRAHAIVTFGLLAIGLGAIGVSAFRLATGRHPSTSDAGIVVAGASFVVLGVLAVLKVRIAGRVPSAALRSDGFLSGVGAAQAAVVLLGAEATSVLAWHWADSLAAMVVGAIAVAIAVATIAGEHERSGVHLDHLILAVNDRDASVAFFTDVMGFACESEAGPFTVIRVNPDLTLQLSPSTPRSAGSSRPASRTATRSTTSATCAVPVWRPAPAATRPRCTSSIPTSTSSRSATTGNEGRSGSSHLRVAQPTRARRERVMRSERSCNRRHLRSPT